MVFRTDSTAPGIISHEGSHAADGSVWVASGFSNSKNPTTYQTEFDAFEVTFLQAQADFNNTGRAKIIIGGWYKEPGKAPELPLIVTFWDASWKEADRATMRANNINNLLARPEKAGGYGLTPTDPTHPFKKGTRFPK